MTLLQLKHNHQRDARDNEWHPYTPYDTLPMVYGRHSLSRLLYGYCLFAATFA
jgi:hypothetical protein